MFRSNHARIWRTTSIEYNITQWSVSDNNLPQNKCFSVFCAKSVAIYGGDGGEIVFKKSLHALNPCFTRKLIKNWVLWSWVGKIIQNQLRRGSGTSVKAGHRRFNAYHVTVISYHCLFSPLAGSRVSVWPYDPFSEHSRLLHHRQPHMKKSSWNPWLGRLRPNISKNIFITVRIHFLRYWLG